MEMQQIIEQAKENIWQAIRDYGAHTNQTEVLDDVSDAFVDRLAEDSSHAKQELRELFSKSPVWDEKLDALVINGTRTHNPDYSVVYDLGFKILYNAIYKDTQSDLIFEALRFFSSPNNEDDQRKGLEAIKKLAPKAYAPGKKLSRVFKALCDALGVSDNTAGSEFQRLYAQFADELSAKKISFKLFVSINPAHFLTMSNPKRDNRGNTLTSCHSFNSTDYDYNNGCSGYARDSVTFIVFTVDDPTNPESLNNRKTSRQIFAYKPGNGLLLQSRLYNTSGGTHGAQAESKIYRDLIQREISMLEGAANLWKTYSFCNGYTHTVNIGPGFGGYPDWTYSDFDGKVSIRSDHEADYEPLVVGTYGLCICCGTEIKNKLYCDDCENDGCGEWSCEDCGEWVVESERCIVRNSNGDEIEVCEQCRDRYYTMCDDCEEYYPNDDISRATGRNGETVYVCDDCLREHYTRCDECGEYYHDDIMYEVTNAQGSEVYVCEDCFYQYYTECAECGGYHHHDRIITVHVSETEDRVVCPECCENLYTQCEDCGEWFDSSLMVSVYRKDGTEVNVCRDCAESSYTVCPHCGEMIEESEDGTCPVCGAVIEECKEEIAV